MFGTIYGIRELTGGETIYVGQTRNALSVRWREHKKGKSLLSAVVELLGADNFEIYVLEKCSAEDMNDREKHWIAMLGTLAPYGANVREGGSRGRVSDASKAKMAEAKREFWADPALRDKALHGMLASWTEDRKAKQSEMTKRQMADPKAREAISEANSGRTRSAGTKEILSEAIKAKWSDEAYREKQIKSRVGKKQSEETKKKRRDTYSAKEYSPELKAKLAAAANKRWAKVREGTEKCLS